MELVLSEPEIRQPVLCTFDGDGRMYVAEMRTYMQDIDATGEDAPTSLVSLHESTRHNGVYDRHTVFADHLVLPRMVLPLDGRGVLIGQTYSDTLDLYRDTTGSGHADQKSVFYQGNRVDANLEHQSSGLLWSIDNWIYETTRDYRLRWTPQGVKKESIPPDGGQWGLAQDDYGKLWPSNAGGEKSFLNFQVHSAYGQASSVNQFAPDFLTVWPLVPIPDVQGGYSRFRPVEKTLNHFTGCCGEEIFRGDRLPPDLYGDALLCEPVGRLIRRAKVTEQDGITHLANVYDHSEFIRSTDPNFRPVNLTTGPDGCLYIVDMYRGIIQQGAWTSRGSYLRNVILRYGLDKNIGGGRIWRLVHDGYTPGPQPHMLEETSAQLVSHLDHPNGWWRDTAQKLLVLRQDRSVVPTLLAMVHGDPRPLARIHALWTLEGLNALPAELVREEMKDPDPHMRCAAIRASETLYKAGNTSLATDIIAMEKDPSIDVSLQSYMTGKRLGFPDWHRALSVAVTSTASAGFRELGKQLIVTPRSFDRQHFLPADIALLQKGQTVFAQICFACHGYDATGMPLDGPDKSVTIAPPLAGSPTVRGPLAGMASVLLHGLTGPVHGKNYTMQMVPMGSNNDQWVAAVASYVRNDFGNNAGMIEPQDVARIRAATSAHPQPWTLPEINGQLIPRVIGGRETWKVTASSNPREAPLAIDGKPGTRYESGAHQKGGEWYQVQLPAETLVSGVYLTEGRASSDFPRKLRVDVSNDGNAWQTAVTDSRSGAAQEIAFPPVKTRFIRLVQTGSDSKYYWSISELQLLQPSAQPFESASNIPTNQSANLPAHD
jgi:mono/diheme cytochrome c family protein